MLVNAHFHFKVNGPVSTRPLVPFFQTSAFCFGQITSLPTYLSLAACLAELPGRQASCWLKFLVKVFVEHV